MTRRRILCIGLSAVFLFLLAGCGLQKFVFPEERDFEIRLEIVSVTEYDETNYQVQIKTVFKNNCEQNLELNSGVSLLDLLLNSKYVPAQKDAAAASYALDAFAEYVETKIIEIPKSEFIGSQLQADSRFFIEGKRGTKQDYIVKSEVYTLTEEDL